MKKRLRNTIALAIAIALCAVFGAVAPASAEIPTPSSLSVRFVRSVADCNVAKLTLVGLPPRTDAIITVGWYIRGNPKNDSAGFEYVGSGGLGLNWKKRFNARTFGTKFPKQAFDATVALSLRDKRGNISTLFSVSVPVRACGK